MAAYTLALVMIVRDEAHNLQRCLDSVRDVVDEILVLDTGSQDGTIAVAKAAGALVHSFTWVNDFSAARNAALALSHCDWRLVLDADEVLRPDAHSKAALLGLKHIAPTFVGRIAVHSTFETAQGLTQSAPSLLSRVLPKGAVFEGVIHEQVASDWPRQDLRIDVDHDGYRPDAMRRKGARNRLLLESAVAASPTDPYLRYQLGKDHEVHDRFQDAWPHYERALALVPSNAVKPPSWRHDLVLRAMFTLKALGQTQQAFDMGLDEQANWRESADFHFVLGDVLLDLAIAHPEQAHDIIPMIQALWQRCLQLGDTLSLEGAVKGRGSYLAEHNLQLLAGVARELGIPNP